ncbi:MAG: formylglycine-generating enzyme family protein [bacterium]
MKKTGLAVILFLLFCLGLVFWVAGAPLPPTPSGMVLIPAGSFKMGADEEFLRKRLHKQIWAGYEPEYINETPEHEVYLGDFFIDEYPVTLEEYTRFLYNSQKMGISSRLMALMDQEEKIPDLKDSPVIGVTWFDARRYAEWAGKQVPSERQWEKAARGGKGFFYPWGNDFPPAISRQFAEVAKVRTGRFGSRFLPVEHRSLAFDTSPYGVKLMGNPPAEWTSSPYRGYSGNSYFDKAYGKIYNIGGSGKGFRTPAYVIKKAEVDILGKSYKNPHYIRYCLIATFRGFSTPQYKGELLGFRCVKPVRRKGWRGFLLDAWQRWQEKRSLAGLYQ